MERASLIQKIKERGLRAKSLGDAPEEVRNIVRLASLLVDIQLRNKNKKGGTQ